MAVDKKHEHSSLRLMAVKVAIKGVDERVVMATQSANNSGLFGLEVAMVLNNTPFCRGQEVLNFLIDNSNVPSDILDDVVVASVGRFIHGCFRDMYDDGTGLY